MVFNESLEAQQKARQLDEEYEKNTWEWYKKAKEDKLWFYWDFKKPDSKKEDPFKEFHKHQKEKIYDPKDPIPDTEIPQFEDTWAEDIYEKENTKQEKIDNSKSKYTPIINRLFESNQISEATKNILLKQDLNKKPNLNWIKEISETEKEIISQTFDKLDKKSPKENLTNLAKDIKELKKTDILKWFETKFENWKFEDEVLNKIWEHYIEFKDNNWEKDIESDLSTAILQTQNEILSEVKNLKTDSETYKKAIENINSWDLKKQLDWIESLYYLAYSQEWKLAKASLSKFKEKKKKKLIEKYQEIEKQINSLEQNKQKTLEQKQKLEQLKAQKESIIKQAKEIDDKWDIFKATKLDKASSSKETKEKSSN